MPSAPSSTAVPTRGRGARSSATAPSLAGQPYYPRQSRSRPKAAFASQAILPGAQAVHSLAGSSSRSRSPIAMGQQWFRAHLVPKEDVDIKEGSWDVMGLRATASIDYSITDKFVPAYRTFEYPFLSDGNSRHPSARGLVELAR